jgi:hypothetical protein
MEATISLIPCDQGAKIFKRLFVQYFVTASSNRREFQTNCTQHIVGISMGETPDEKHAHVIGRLRFFILFLIFFTSEMLAPILVA